MIAIAISAPLKVHMLDRWSSLFGYQYNTLFPDLEGFCRVQGASAGFAATLFVD